MIGRGFLVTLDPLELDRVLANGRLDVRDRLVACFADWPQTRRTGPWQQAKASRFIYVVSGFFLESSVGRCASVSEYPRPFGWCWERPCDLDVYLLMPTWLYYLRRIRDARWACYRALVRLGLWKVKEGDYYVNGGWTWGWWSTLGERYGTHAPRTRWERVGWWIQRAINDMEAPYA